MSHVAMFTPYGSLPRPTVPRKTPATAERTRWPLAPEGRSGLYQSRRRRGHHPPGRGWPKGRRRRMSGVGIHAHDSSMEAIPLYHCFHSRPLLQVCTLSSCPTFFWQRWRLPSSAIFSFTQHGFFPRGHLNEAKATGPPAELIGDNTHRSHGPGLLEASRTSSAVAWNERFPTKRLVSITHLLPHAGPSVYEPRRRRPSLRAGLEGPSPGSRVQLDHVTVFHRMLTPHLLSVESGSGPSVAKPVRRHRRLLNAAPETNRSPSTARVVKADAALALP